MTVVTVAPLGFAMGHFFPAGLRVFVGPDPALGPWAWLINSCAAVIAAAATPVLAMHIGFSGVLVTALGCYLYAGGLPTTHPEAPR